MANPRVSDDIKRKRGTYRADRAEDFEPDETDEAFAEYRRLWNDAYVRAIAGQDVKEKVAYLKRAEQAMAANGLTARDGSPWQFSEIVRIAAGLKT